MCRDYGAEVVLTDPACRTGSDRVAELTRKLGWQSERVVVHVQADEPHVPIDYINRVGALAAEHDGATLCTLASPLRSLEEWISPHVVKVICNRHGYALYFSRAPIPWARDHLRWGTTPEVLPGQGHCRHMGLYAYRVGFIERYVTWESPGLKI